MLGANMSYLFLPVQSSLGSGELAYSAAGWLSRFLPRDDQHIDRAFKVESLSHQPEVGARSQKRLPDP